ncbi:hypothetical protein [Streptomyces sp. NPDC053720]|uniref:hypothetical protein n=1 Tax=Streptomyces sp. NPDC053720 TaxID=3154855 RepID=UPI0034221711
MNSDSPWGDGEQSREILDRERRAARIGWTAILSVLGFVGIVITAVVALILIAAAIVMYVVVAAD